MQARFGLTYSQEKAFIERQHPRFSKWHRPDTVEKIAAKLSAGLGEITDSDVFSLLLVIKQQASVLGQVQKVLTSDTYACPGNHWSRRLTDAEWEAWQTYSFGSRSYYQDEPDPNDPHGTDEILWTDPESGTTRAIRTKNGTYVWPEFDQARFIFGGQCDGIIDVEWDTEYGEYGSVLSSWPYFAGPCAEAMRMTQASEDSGNTERIDEHPVMIALGERAWLRGRILKIAHPYGIEAISELEREVASKTYDVQYARDDLARTLWQMPRESY